MGDKRRPTELSLEGMNSIDKKMVKQASTSPLSLMTIRSLSDKGYHKYKNEAKINFNRESLTYSDEDSNEIIMVKKKKKKKK